MSTRKIGSAKTFIHLSDFIIFKNKKNTLLLSPKKIGSYCYFTLSFLSTFILEFFLITISFYRLRNKAA